MRTRTRTSLTALLLGTILVVPGVGAMVCAPEAECMVETAPTEAMDHCSGMQQREAEESVRGDAKSIDCCLEPAEPAEITPVLTTSAESTRMDLDLVTPVGTPSPVVVEIRDRSRDGTRPGEALSPATFGRDLRTLHQSFLN